MRSPGGNRGCLADIGWVGLRQPGEVVSIIWARNGAGALADNNQSRREEGKGTGKRYKDGADLTFLLFTPVEAAVLGLGQ